MFVIKTSLSRPQLVPTFIRWISSTRPKLVNNSFEGGEEIRIPVAWGHIAGQWWGRKDRRPLLAISGWKDNIGTFLPLISEISKQIPIVCIEWPGQGFSTPFPKGFYYDFEAALNVVHAVIRHFNWNKTSIIGHSLGSITSFAYAGVFPDEVDMIIGIDGLAPTATLNDDYIDIRGATLDAFYEMDHETHIPQLMSYEEAQVAVADSMPIPLEHTHLHLQRELARSKEDPNKFYFTTDPRQNIRGPCWSPEIIFKMAERVKCPVLNFKATEFPFIESKKVYMACKDILLKNGVYFEKVDVEGSHFIHLTNTNKMVPHIVKFLGRFDTGGRIGTVDEDVLELKRDRS